MKKTTKETNKETKSPKKTTEKTNNKKTNKSTKAETTEKSIIEVMPETEKVDIRVEENLSDKLFYDPEKVQLDLEGLSQISKEVRSSSVSLDDNQIRLIIDNYYATQHHRMNIANQIRSVKQGFDEVLEGEQPAIAWLLADVQNRENQIKKMVAAYVDKNDVCKWATAIKGIGPMFAANLYSYIDMNKCNHANQFLAYCGLNDNNDPWLGKEKAREVVDRAYDELKLKPSDPVSEEVFAKISSITSRNIVTIIRGFDSHREKDSKSNDKTVLINYLAKPPYNTELKKIVHLIGQSFKLVSKRGSKYGQLYRERKAWEIQQNENLAYKEQAERMLKEKNYRTETDTYQYLIQGKLSPAHIDKRAVRFATKIFLTHFFEATWFDKYGTEPPVIYPICYLGHVDYITPEVPFGDYIPAAKKYNR